MKCPNPQCGEKNVETHKFCSHCGTALQADLKSLVREALAEQTKKDEELDEKVVKLSDERVAKLAKLVASWLAVPVAILIVAAGLFGYSKLTDVEHAAAKVQDQLSNQLAQSTRRMDEFQKDLEQKKTNLQLAAELPARVVGFTNTLASLELQVAALRTSAAKFEGLSERVKDLEQSENGVSIPPEIAAKFEKYLQPYATYLKNLGFNLPEQKVEFRRTTLKVYEATVHTPLEKPERFVIGEQLFTNSEFQARPNSLLFCLTEYVLAQRENSDAFFAVAWGLANYYPGSFLDEPDPFPMITMVTLVGWDQSLAGTNTLWALTNMTSVTTNIGYSELGADEPLAELCWELRTKAGKAKTDRWLHDAWESFQGSVIRAGRPSDPDDFTRALYSRLQSEEPELAPSFKQMAERRYFKVDGPRGPSRYWK